MAINCVQIYTKFWHKPELSLLPRYGSKLSSGLCQNMDKSELSVLPYHGSSDLSLLAGFGRDRLI